MTTPLTVVVPADTTVKQIVDHIDSRIGYNHGHSDVYCDRLDVFYSIEPNDLDRVKAILDTIDLVQYYN